MNSSTFHPALVRLLRLRSIARLRRLRRRLSSPRRLVLSTLACLLALLWLGNAITSILFRASADPEMLRRWVPLGFAVYGLWHLVKAAYRRPEQGIEWSPAERDLLEGGPFSRHQLLSYRLATVFGAAVLKAACFTALMVPDLKLRLPGFVGALTALTFLELWRMNVEITACGVGKATYMKLRGGVLLCVAAALFTTITIAVYSLPAVETARLPAVLVILKHLGTSAAQLESTLVGQIICAPFQLFSDVILADHYSGLLALRMALGILAVLAMVGMTYRVDRFFQRRRVEHEQHTYLKTRVGRKPARAATAAARNAGVLPWRGGGVALAWRQLLGARHYWISVLIAFSAPTFLALIPLVVYRDSRLAFMNVFGGLAFYSLLLLPAALRFDFRRDVDRMVLLKSLPMSPRATVVGQLVAPVALASVYQLCVLLAAAVIRPIGPGFVVAGWLLLIPMNISIFALDNLLFLLYPYRQNQEGLEVFLRTTLTFTAKGILFALVLAVMAGWALLAGALVHKLAPGTDARVGTRFLFIAGMGVMVVSAAFMTVRLTIRAFGRFDASQDVPA